MVHGHEKAPQGSHGSDESLSPRADMARAQDGGGSGAYAVGLPTLQARRGVSQVTEGEHAMRGLGRVFKRGEVCWIAYSWRGTEHRESAQSTRESDARRLLKKRLGEIGRGRLIGSIEER